MEKSSSLAHTSTGKRYIRTMPYYFLLCFITSCALVTPVLFDGEESQKFSPIMPLKWALTVGVETSRSIWKWYNKFIFGEPGIWKWCYQMWCYSLQMYSAQPLIWKLITFDLNSFIYSVDYQFGELQQISYWVAMCMYSYSEFHLPGWIDFNGCFWTFITPEQLGKEQSIHPPYIQ